jgi:hypothetical protein
MPDFVKFDAFGETLVEKKHNLNSDLIKVYLTNNTPDPAAHTVKADLTEIDAVNGYTANGYDPQNVTNRVGGTTQVVAGRGATFTATGGSIGPFRYVVLFNQSQSSPLHPLIGYWDLGSAITLTEGSTMDLDFVDSIIFEIAPDVAPSARLDAGVGAIALTGSIPETGLAYGAVGSKTLIANGGAMTMTGTAATLTKAGGGADIIFRGDFESGTIPWDWHAYSVQGAGTTLTADTVASLGITAAVPGHLKCGHAHFGGSTDNDFSRVHFIHTTFGIPVWGEGSDVWYSGRFYFPDGFIAAKESHIDLLRWDAYVNGSNDMQGGLGMTTTDDYLKIMTNFPGTTPLDTGYLVPEEEWLHIEVHQVISQFDGTARNEIFVNGDSKGSSTTANYKGTLYPSGERAINRLRFGLVSESSATQVLDLYFDDMVISDGQVGP